MTCIAVARLSKNKCIMAGDRRVTVNMQGDYITYHQPKVCKINGVLMGFSGDTSIYRPLTLISELSKFKDQSKTVESANAYFYRVIIPAVRKMLSNTGYIPHNPFDSDLDYKNMEADILFAVNGRCFEISIDKGVVHGLEMPLPYATGSGGIHAQDILFFLRSHYPDMQPKECLRYALEHTATVNAGCDNNIDFIQE